MAYDTPGAWRPEGHGGQGGYDTQPGAPGGARIPHQRDPAGDIPTDPGGGAAGGRHAAAEPAYDTGGYPASPPPASFQTDRFEMGGYPTGGYDPGYAYPGGGYDAGYDTGYDTATQQATAAYAPPGPDFGDVFDDPPAVATDTRAGSAADQRRAAREYPPHRRPAGEEERTRVRDRIGVHLLWELLLALAVAGLGYLVWQAQPGALEGDALAGLLVTGTGLLLLGLAAGVTMRTSAPNLAIGPVAAAAGVYFADRGAEGVVTPTIFALGVAILLGVATAVLAAGLHVPGWAASLAAAAATVTWLQLQPAEVPRSGEFDPTGRAAVLFAVVAAVGTLAALVATGGGVRWAVGEFRPDGDPARRRGGRAAMITGLSLVLSMALAVLAGVLLVAGSGAPAEGSVGVDWLTWTVVGFGVALLGGTSAFGRRGGVFGTTLAVVGVVLFHRLQEIHGWEIALLATATGAMVVGLAVTRLMERFGRRPDDAARADDDTLVATAAEPLPGSPAPGGAAPAAGVPTAPQYWPEAEADAWASTLPARPAPLHPTPWDEERWNGR